jgi:hypothetical protein
MGRNSGFFLVMIKKRATKLLLPILLLSTVLALAQTKKPTQQASPSKKDTKPAASKSTQKTVAAPPQEQGPTTLQKGVTQVQTVLNTMYEPQKISTFHPGDAAVNLGFGLFGANHGYDVFGSVKQSPAWSVSYERGLTDSFGPGTLSVGGLLGYKHYYYNFPRTEYKASWTDIMVMARGTYHYNLTKNPQIDTYAGLTVGVRLNSYSNTNNSTPRATYTEEGLHLATGIFLGGRYFLTDKLGVFAEAGYDMTYLKFGVTGKF